MNFSGSLLFNAFAGDDNRRPMTRSIHRIGSREYAIYLNEAEEGTIAAVHAVTGRNGNSPIVDKNALAMSECVAVTDIDGVQWKIVELQFDDVTIANFAVTTERTNPNDNQYRLSMPMAIARIRFGKPKAKGPSEDAPAASGTGF